jgi:hypothetical protein
LVSGKKSAILSVEDFSVSGQNKKAISGDAVLFIRDMKDHSGVRIPRKEINIFGSHSPSPPSPPLCVNLGCNQKYLSLVITHVKGFCWLGVEIEVGCIYYAGTVFRTATGRVGNVCKLEDTYVPSYI